MSYICPECQYQEDEQYTCTSCWGKKVLTQEEAELIISNRSDIDIDDFEKIID